MIISDIIQLFYAHCILLFQGLIYSPTSYIAGLDLFPHFILLAVSSVLSDYERVWKVKFEVADRRELGSFFLGSFTFVIQK